MQTAAKNRRIPRLELLLLLMGLLAVGGALVWIATLNEPLGWDESVYASKARSWLDGTPMSGWGLHRAFALPVMGYVALLFTDSESGFRIVSALWDAGAFFMIWLVGRTVLRSSAGLVAGAVFVASGPFLRRASQFLTDIPAVVLLLAIIAIIWKQLERPGGPSPWLLAVGPLAAAVAYVRFGSLSALASIGLVVVAVWWRTLFRSWQLVLGVVISFFVALIPHFVYSTNVTGTPWGLWAYSGRPPAAQREYLGEGLLPYVKMFPVELAGLLGGAIMMIGLVVGLWVLFSRLRGRDLRSTQRGYGYLLGIGVVNLILMGLVSHAQARFVFMSIAVLLVVGAEFLRSLVARLLPRAGQVIVAALVVIGLSIDFGASALEEYRLIEADGRSAWLAPAAGEMIRGLTSGDCIVMTSRVPQLHWYTGCEVHGLNRIGSDYSGDQFIVLIESGRPESNEVAIADDFSENIALVGTTANPSGRGRYAGFRLYQVHDAG